MARDFGLRPDTIGDMPAIWVYRWKTARKLKAEVAEDKAGYARLDEGFS